MKRIFPLLLSLFLLLTVLPISSVAAEEEQIIATEDDVILLAGSDFQVGNGTFQIEKIFTTLEVHGLTKADGAFFVGDYTAEARESNTSAKGIEVLKKLYQPIVGDTMIFTQGNHDPVDTEGLAKEGNNDPASGKYGVFVINEDQRMDYNDEDSYDKTKEAADALKVYLDEKAEEGYTKPIFVLNHIGLHWGNRTIKAGCSYHGYLLVDVLNEAGAKGLNIIYLYGHSHSGGYDDWLGGGAVYFKKGDVIPVAMGSKKKEDAKDYTINFTYMNAGYIGYYSTTAADADATVTMSVFLIRGDEVIITRYDSEINLTKGKYGIHNLKSPGVWHEDYLKEDYHATPNTLEYASSRKVTATSDVEVTPPRYSPYEEEEPDEEEPTVTTTTSSTVPTITTVKTEASVAPSATTSVTTTADTAVSTTASTQAVTESTSATTDPTAPSEQDGGEKTSSTPDPSTPWGLIFGTAGGAVLIIGFVVFVWVYKRKK